MLIIRKKTLTAMRLAQKWKEFSAINSKVVSDAQSMVDAILMVNLTVTLDISKKVKFVSRKKKSNSKLTRY